MIFQKTIRSSSMYEKSKPCIITYSPNYAEECNELAMPTPCDSAKATVTCVYAKAVANRLQHCAR